MGLHGAPGCGYRQVPYSTGAGPHAAPRPAVLLQAGAGVPKPGQGPLPKHVWMAMKEKREAAKKKQRTMALLS